MKRLYRIVYFIGSGTALLSAALMFAAYPTGVWPCSALAALAAVMFMDAFCWGLVSASGGSSDSRINALDLVGVLASVCSLVVAAIAAFWMPGILIWAILTVFIYTGACTTYWVLLPRRDRFLLGEICRAWGIDVDPLHAAGVYQVLFTVCSCVVALAFALVALRVINDVHDIWVMFAVLLWLYAALYFCLGAPLKRLLRQQALPGANVFISYSRKDVECAKRINDAIRANGLTTWLDLESLRQGEKLPGQLASAIEFSDVFMVIISANSIKSVWVSRELSHASARAPRKRLLPVLIEPWRAEFASFLGKGGLSTDATTVALALSDCTEESVRSMLLPALNPFSRS